ncbi:MAG: hypothetical protein JJ921_09785 [Pseudomonadales bacterium]|nr:hypothetical protein [Pseudomonadales bacterium]MBO7004762.1 hypothetical protein [Pseudomonadales bacterium]
MSSFVLSTGQLQVAVPPEVRAAKNYNLSELNLGAYQGYLARVDDPLIWGPADHQGSHVVLLGRPAFESKDWRRASHLPGAGGLAARLVLDVWRSKPEKLCEFLSGSLVALLYDGHVLKVITDRMGILPVYEYKTDVHVLGSCADEMVDACQLSVNLDATTAATFLSTGSTLPPYTYYEGVHQLESASQYCWENTKTSVHEYWSPAFIDGVEPESVTRLSEELADGMYAAVRKRTTGLFKNTGLLLSAGADSRAVLFSSGAETTTGITLYDEPNPELETARQLADAVGVEHVAVQRDPEYYLRHARANARLSGGMSSIIGGHFLGVSDLFEDLALDVLLTGCYADYMFKGLVFNRRHKTAFGRNLPIFEPAPFSYEFYHPFLALKSSWQRSVDNRFREHFSGCDVNNAYAVENRRFRPISREADYCGRDVLLKVTPFDWVLGDSDVLKVYERMSVEHRMNGEVFERAVRLMTPPSADKVRNNNYNARIGRGQARKVFDFLISVAKRKVGLLPNARQDRLATVGSWPNWSYVAAHSVLLRELWNETSPHAKEVTRDLLGFDPWQTDHHALDVTLCFRILTFCLWLDRVRS